MLWHIFILHQKENVAIYTVQAENDVNCSDRSDAIIFGVGSTYREFIFGNFRFKTFDISRWTEKIAVKLALLVGSFFF